MYFIRGGHITIVSYLDMTYECFDLCISNCKYANADKILYQ